MRTLIVLILASFCSPCLAQYDDKLAENKAKLEARREAKKRSAELRLKLHRQAQGFGGAVVVPQVVPQVRPVVPAPVPVVPRVFQIQDIYGYPKSNIVIDGNVIGKYDVYGYPTGYGVMRDGGLQMYDIYGYPMKSIVPLR